MKLCVCSGHLPSMVVTVGGQSGPAGNPVFSIKQTDIIYYGADLGHYLLNEFVDQDYALHTHAQEIRKIRTWSFLANDGDWPFDRAPAWFVLRQ